MRLVAIAAITAAMLMSVTPAGHAQAPVVPAPSYAQDFDLFWQFVEENYAYFDIKATDWAAVRDKYGKQVQTVSSKREFITVLEGAVGELYDAHAHLATATGASPRMTPTDADLWAEWRNGHAVITDVRAGSAAEQAGLRPGMTVVTVHGVPVAQATDRFAPHALKAADPAAQDWALRVALAGPRDAPVRLTAANASGKTVEVSFTPGVQRPATLLTAREEGGIGIIRINNSLGDTALIAAFDEALDKLAHTRGLVLDLRDTPSGGNTTVARGMMGRLVAKETAYQKHELVSDFRETGVRRTWVEYVSPRGKMPYTKPVVVLSGHWTGSMGEGMTIALDGMKRATTMGTPLAGLLGALTELQLPYAGFTVRIPNEKLYHLNGTPRERFKPAVYVAPGKDGVDAGLAAALAHLRKR